MRIGLYGMPTSGKTFILEYGIRSDLNSTQSYWTGNASDNFKKMSSKISLNFEDFSRELKCCQYYIQKCSEEYQNLDNKNKEEIKEILEQSKIFNL